MEAEKPAKIVPQTILTQTGAIVLIREAEVKDADDILIFGRELFAETDQVLTLPEEFIYTLEQEEDMVRGYKMRTDALLLVAVYEERIIGMTSFSCHKRLKMRHGGEMGISVLSGYRRNGIARRMMQMLLEWASGVAQVEKIYLNVFHTNPNAINLYKELGFTEEGRQAKAIKQVDGSYADMITMSYFK